MDTLDIQSYKLALLYGLLLNLVFYALLLCISLSNLLFQAVLVLSFSLVFHGLIKVAL